jgi:hypothetical protein
MFAELWSALRKSPTRRPQRSGPLNRRLCLEALEDRNLLSGGPGPSTANVSGSGSPQVAVVTPSGGSSSSSGQTSGGSGSGAVGISGPGYPLAPTSGPTRPDPTTLSQPPGGTTLVAITGTPGGPDPTVAVVPVCTGTSPVSGTGG